MLRAMSEIRTAQFILLYLFDIAESVDLTAIPPLIGGPAVPARFAPKPATPAYVQYDNPPLIFEGEAVGVPEVDGFRPRFRVYDYGVVSVALVKPFAGSWAELVDVCQTLLENADLEQRAEVLCRSIGDRLASALIDRRQTYLSEDYLVVFVSELDGRQTADELLAVRGDDIAAMLRGERQPLSAQEKASVLQHRISYLDDDLVVPAWNAAFVYDTPAGGQAALEILEFANSQLLEFREYDAMLDRELEAIYARLQKPRRIQQRIGSSYTRAARDVHALFIEVNKLTDRTENALKFIGDIYAARLFSIVGSRLGLGTWKADVEAKLKTLDDIYRFAVEQTGMARGEALELMIVLILIFELVLFFMGIMR
jgi:hypothetical protein